MKTECGLFGCIMKIPLDKEIIYNAMSNIQHRGQDSYGYVTVANGKGDGKWDCKVDVKLIKHFGLLSEYEKFEYDENTKLFLGHMRYSTNTQLENDALENSLNKAIFSL